MEPCNEPARCRDTCIRLANLYCNINNIRVRSFILTGAPKIHGSLPDASLPGGYLIAQ